jgi:hypothetical protein
MKADFDRLAPEERRIILVASDERYQALVHELDRKMLLGLLGLLAAGGFGVFGAGAASVFLAKTLGATARGLLKAPGEEASGGGGLAKAKGLVTAALTKGEIVLPHLPPEEAARRFRFDLGDPEDGAAYLASPLARDHYLKPALANERLAQEKMSAFVRLAAALGAKRIVLVSADTEHRKAGGKASAPLPEVAAQLGITAQLESDGSASRQICMEFDPPRSAPSVPGDLAPWLAADPVLHALADTRMTARPRLARAALSFGETVDFGAEAMLTLAKLAGRGVELGGTYRRVAKSTFCFEIEYYPVD